VLAKRCTEDKWPQEVIDCYAAAASQKDFQTCRMKLPQDQAQKLQADQMQVMFGGGKGPGGNGAPPFHVRAPGGSGSGVVPPGQDGSGSAAPAQGSGSAAPAQGSGSAAPAQGPGSTKPAGSGSAH
jgi:hypothetical protein